MCEFQICLKYAIIRMVIILKKTVLCYIVKENRVLMLYRNKKINDLNAGKWIGVGGHIENGETPNDAIVREVYEETGYNLLSYKQRGVVDFFNNNSYGERMYVYIADSYSGDIRTCDEGDLEWFLISDLDKLSMWEGDKIFLDILFNSNDYFELELHYENDKLIRSERSV